MGALGAGWLSPSFPLVFRGEAAQRGSQLSPRLSRLLITELQGPSYLELPEILGILLGRQPHPHKGPSLEPVHFLTSFKLSVEGPWLRVIFLQLSWIVSFCTVLLQRWVPYCGGFPANRAGGPPGRA